MLLKDDFRDDVVMMTSDAPKAKPKHQRIKKPTPFERAETLLLSHLTPAQQAQWEIHRYFETIGASGRVYRIFQWMTSHHGSRNVVWIRDGCEVVGYCAFPRVSLPDADIVLAQKLAIETDDHTFTKIACAAWMLGQYSAMRDSDKIAPRAGVAGWMDHTLGPRQPLSWRRLLFAMFVGAAFGNIIVHTLPLLGRMFHLW